MESLCSDCKDLQDASVRGHCECVNTLIKTGADVNMMDTSGRTPLMLVLNAENDDDDSSISSYKCVGLLMNAGADVNLSDNWGDTPLRGPESSLIT